MYRLATLLFFLVTGNIFAELLVVHADAECRLSVDGKSHGTLMPGKKVQLKLIAGEHHIEATPLAGGTKWLQAVTIQAASSSTPHVLNILVGQPHDYWIDPSTGLMWTATDNGSGLSWGQAQRYCSELSQDGFKDWTLPGIEQLQDLFTGASESAKGTSRAPDETSNSAKASGLGVPVLRVFPIDAGGFHIKGPFKLSGWQWSSSFGQQPGEGWAFDFGDGGRASVAAGDSGLNRALCVRPAR